MSDSGCYRALGYIVSGILRDIVGCIGMRQNDSLKKVILRDCAGQSLLALKMTYKHKNA